MKRKNIYQADVIVDEKLDKYLKKCFINHLIIYNYSLDILIKNPGIKFKDLKFKCHEFIKQKNINEFIRGPLFNEIYYQYKRFTEKNIHSAKTLTKIHYITFLASSYTNKSFSKEGKKLILRGIDGYIELDKDLPELPKPPNEKKVMYFNLSYSNFESKYQLSVFQ